jgi:hypothetical protein
MKMKKIYQLRRIKVRLEIKVIHAKLIAGNVKFLNMCPVVN